MNLRDFLETKYDVREQIATLKSNPILDFINSDIFPFDFIDNQDGELVKMLYYADGKKTISVLNLLSYRREDLVRYKDMELLELYDIYTEDLHLEELDMENPIKLEDIRQESLKRRGLDD